MLMTAVLRVYPVLRSSQTSLLRLFNHSILCKSSPVARTKPLRAALGIQEGHAGSRACWEGPQSQTQGRREEDKGCSKQERQQDKRVTRVRR